MSFYSLANLYVDELLEEELLDQKMCILNIDR